MKQNNVNAQEIPASSFLPKSAYAQEVMAVRAEHLAEKIKILTPTGKKKYYIRFELGRDHRFGIDFEQVKEVIHCTTITPLPLTPDYVIGVINYRGQLISIIDLRALFGFEKVAIAENKHIIIVTVNQLTVGFLTDYIDNSRSYTSSSLVASLAVSKKIKPAYVMGLHKGKTAILNIEAVITDFKNELKTLVLGNRNS